MQIKDHDTISGFYRCSINICDHTLYMHQHRIVIVRVIKKPTQTMASTHWRSNMNINRISLDFVSCIETLFRSKDLTKFDSISYHIK